MLQRQHHKGRYLKKCLKDLAWNMVWILVKYLLFPSYQTLNPEMTKFNAMIFFFPKEQQSSAVQILKCNFSYKFARCSVEGDVEWNLGAVVIAGPKALKATPNRVCTSKVHSQGISNGHQSFSFGEKEVGQGGFPEYVVHSSTWKAFGWGVELVKAKRISILQ